MGFNLFETSDMLMRINYRRRNRSRNRHPVTLWGVIFLVAAVVLILFVKIWDAKDKSKGNGGVSGTVKTFAVILAIVFIILSNVADALGDKN